MFGIAIRNMQKVLLYALFEAEFDPPQEADNFTSIQTKQEAYKMMPIGDLWNEFLERECVKYDYLSKVKRYEEEVLSKL